MRLTDLPKPLNSLVYEGVRTRIKELYGAQETVTEVIEYGTIPLPGISDMDFMVIVQPGGSAEIPSLKAFKDNEQYAQDHMHFVLSESSIPHLRSFDPWLFQGTPLLNKRGFSIDEVDESSEEGRHALSLDFIFLSWMIPSIELIGKIHTEDTIEVRDFLEEAKGTQYCYRELKRAGCTNKEGDEDTIGVQQLREEWYSIPESDRELRITDVLKQFTETVTDICAICTNAYEKRSEMRQAPEKLKKNALLQQYPNSVIITIGTSTYVFQKNQEAIELTTTIYKSPLSKQTYKRSIMHCPLALSATQNRLLFEEGLVPDAFRQCCSTDLDQIPVLTHEALEKRTRDTNTVLAETKNVVGGKLMGKTYGLRLKPDKKERNKGSLKAKLGGVYDRCMQKLVDTKIDMFFSKKETTIVLCI